VGQPRPPGSTFDAQWVSTIGVDLLAFSTLHFLQSGGINYTPLFALPVLLSSVLGPTLLALGTAASVTLLLLADAWVELAAGARGPNARFLQAGLSGSGFFLVALAGQPPGLAPGAGGAGGRTQPVRRAHADAGQRTGDRTLADGVLVVDLNGIVARPTRPPARLLAAGDAVRSAAFILAAEHAWQPLAELTHRTFAEQRRRKPTSAWSSRAASPAAARAHAAGRLGERHA
jgi:two-component system sensor histidine kinase PilS (NtrC family)